MLDELKRLLRRLGLAGHDGSDGGEMISCEEALESLFEYLDGELREEDRERVEQHLEICRRCYPRLQFERSFMEALRRVRSGRKAPRELRGRILETLRAEGLGPD